jgi:hypothetical protein
LVDEHSGQRHLEGPIRDELIASRAARQLPDRTIEVLRRTCVNVNWDIRALEELGRRIERCFDVYLYNLENPLEPRFTQSIAGTLDADQARVVIPQLANHAVIFMGTARETVSHPKHAPKPTSVQSRLDFGIDIEFWQSSSYRSNSARLLKIPGRKRRKSTSTRAESK